MWLGRTLTGVMLIISALATPCAGVADTMFDGRWKSEGPINLRVGSLYVHGDDLTIHDLVSYKLSAPKSFKKGEIFKVLNISPHSDSMGCALPVSYVILTPAKDVWPSVKTYVEVGFFSDPMPEKPSVVEADRYPCSTYSFSRAVRPPVGPKPGRPR